jgi:hypothetical protein
VEKVYTNRCRREGRSPEEHQRLGRDLGCRGYHLIPHMAKKRLAREMFKALVDLF